MAVPFTLVPDVTQLPDEPGCFTARLPVTEGRVELLAALAQALRLPEYFGHNWDALEECLRDLSWIPEGRVRIVHPVVPPYLVYVELLRDAQDFWLGQPAGDGKLLEAVFPASERKRLADLLGLDP